MVIEDEELGLKLAEDDEELFWSKNLEGCEAAIERLRDELRINLLLKEAIQSKIPDSKENQPED